MPGTSNRLRAQLRQHTARAWEAEMSAALGALAIKFEEWKAGTLSSTDLHAAIHDYHHGIAREIWKRFASNNPKMPLAHAVAAGYVTKESLSPEVLEHIEPMVEFFQDLEGSK